MQCIDALVSILSPSLSCPARIPAGAGGGAKGSPSSLRENYLLLLFHHNLNLYCSYQ